MSEKHTIKDEEVASMLMWQIGTVYDTLNKMHQVIDHTSPKWNDDRFHSAIDLAKAAAKIVQMEIENREKFNK